MSLPPKAELELCVDSLGDVVDADDLAVRVAPRLVFCAEHDDGDLELGRAATAHHGALLTTARRLLCEPGDDRRAGQLLGADRARGEQVPERAQRDRELGRGVDEVARLGGGAHGVGEVTRLAAKITTPLNCSSAISSWPRMLLIA